MSLGRNTSEQPRYIPNEYSTEVENISGCSKVRAVILLKHFMSGELDSYEFMPLIVSLRKQAERVKLARIGM